ncbi:MAG TPA: hypothetical protein VF895_02450 [Gaiellaceae bacterium]
MADNKTLLKLSLSVSAFKEFHPFAAELEAAAICESIGGTFGNDDETSVGFKTVHWTCNGIPIKRAEDPDKIFAQAMTLLSLFMPACESYPDAHVAGSLEPDIAHVTCGDS